MSIQRLHADQRMSQIVVHGGIAYLAGQVDLKAPAPDAAEQTRRVLARIDSLLTQAGSSRERILSATIWLSDINNFGLMDSVWQHWLPRSCAPARATVQAQLALPDLLVEISIVAAVIEE